MMKVTRIASDNPVMFLLAGGVALALTAVILMGVFYAGTQWGTGHSQSNNPPIGELQTQTPVIHATSESTEVITEPITQLPTESIQLGGTQTAIPGTADQTATTVEAQTSSTPAVSATSTDSSSGPSSPTLDTWLKLISSS
ncbi:MAG: hypothetical protein P8Y37_11655, partial [Anaerolineales bacterium]